MSIDIHIMPTNRDSACQSRFCNLVDVHAIMHLDRYITCQSTYMECKSIDILYVDQYIYVEILVVDRLLYPTEKYTMPLIFTCKPLDGGGGAVADQVFII